MFIYSKNLTSVEKKSKISYLENLSQGIKTIQVMHYISADNVSWVDNLIELIMIVELASWIDSVNFVDKVH